MTKSNLASGGRNISADFCRAFSKDIDALYSLALVLTGDPQAAETCLLAALDNCLRERPGAERSARSRSRWNMIRQAANVVLCRPDRAHTKPLKRLDTTQSPVMLAIAGLPLIERFAFVVTVLERYSVSECATLLHRQSREIARARVEAMQAIAAELQANPLTMETSDAPIESTDDVRLNSPKEDQPAVAVLQPPGDSPSAAETFCGRCRQSQKHILVQLPHVAFGLRSTFRQT